MCFLTEWWRRKKSFWCWNFDNKTRLNVKYFFVFLPSKSLVMLEHNRISCTISDNGCQQTVFTFLVCFSCKNQIGIESKFELSLKFFSIVFFSPRKNRLILIKHLQKIIIIWKTFMCWLSKRKKLLFSRVCTTKTHVLDTNSQNWC